VRRCYSAAVRWSLLLVACGGSHTADVTVAPPDGQVDAATVQIAITARVDSTRFVTREHLLAAAEMQISGEPLAEAMGRSLAGYSRDALPPDLYTDPIRGTVWIDPAGFSSAVESYEYSKQPMNAVAFELGAGTPLADAVPDWQAKAEHYAVRSGAIDTYVHPGRGWPGMRPTLHLFNDFDPAIAPTSAEVLSCAITSDDTPGSSGAAEQCADYECDATSLGLVHPPPQVIGPGADGFATWKYALWTMNYLQVMHDAQERPVAVGPLLGSSNIEGFQAAMFILMTDQRAADWLGKLLTDGTALTGLTTAQALAYGDASPLVWFPRRIGVPYALLDAGSELLDVAGIALGYATMFAVTDARNAGVGGTASVRAYFTGDPFADDNGVPDGEPTLHDRALAMINIAVVDLDRMHAGGTMEQHGPASTTSLAYTLLALRTVQRATSSQLRLYSNNVPDATGPSVLGDAFAARVARMIRAVAAELAGRSPTGLDDQAAMVRGLFTAYLATGNTAYRAQAIATFDALVADHWDADARIFSDSLPATDVVITPLRFALIQSAIRDMYLQVATRAGGEARALPLEQLLARWNKLVLNGWDDRDQDQRIGVGECATQLDGVPHGGLQMAERTLTGELGRGGHNEDGMPGFPTSDRDGDCVPEIDDAHLPAALADQLTFHVARKP